DEQGALLAESHRAGPLDVAGVDFDAEALGQADGVEPEGLLAAGRGGEDEESHHWPKRSFIVAKHRILPLLCYDTEARPLWYNNCMPALLAESSVSHCLLRSAIGLPDRWRMVESVQFKNFKSLRDTTLALGRFTLL